MKRECFGTPVLVCKREIKTAAHPSGGFKLSKNPFGLFRQRAAAYCSALADARTFVSREVFSATYTPRQKMILFFRRFGGELCEALTS